MTKTISDTRRVLLPTNPDYSDIVESLRDAAVLHVRSRPDLQSGNSPQQIVNAVETAIENNHDQIIGRLRIVAGQDSDLSLLEAVDASDVGEVLNRVARQLTAARNRLENLLFEDDGHIRRLKPIYGNPIEKLAFLRQLEDCVRAAEKIHPKNEAPLGLDPLDWDPVEWDPSEVNEVIGDDPVPYPRPNASEQDIPAIPVLQLAECWRIATNDAGTGDKGQFAEWTMATLRVLAPAIHHRLRAADPVAQLLRRLRDMRLLPPG